MKFVRTLITIALLAALPGCDMRCESKRPWQHEPAHYDRDCAHGQDNAPDQDCE